MLPRYASDGPSSRLRMLQFIPSLEAAGAVVVVEPFFNAAYLKRYFSTGKKNITDAARAAWRRTNILKQIKGHYDLVWVEKELYPFLPEVFEEILIKTGVPYIVDYDDATFHTYDLSKNEIVRRMMSHKLEKLIAGAQAIIVGNAYLESYVRQFSSGLIAKVPTVVDLDRYPVRPFPRQKSLQLGWIGTPNNATYLRPVVDALKSLRKDIAVELVTVGAQGPLLIDRQVMRPWRLEQEGEDVASFDVGIMPIPDEPWERGKCGYKLIQYMAGGRPVIASPVGINCEIVTSEVGFLARCNQEWAEAIGVFADQSELKMEMGKAARQRVEARYSLKVAAPRIINILQQAIGTRV